MTGRVLDYVLPSFCQMMNTINVRNTFTPSIAGKPDDTVSDLSDSDHLGVVPSVIPYIKPKLCVEVGDAVKVGTPLFSDKRRPTLLFTSPAGGTIAYITY